MSESRENDVIVNEQGNHTISFYVLCSESERPIGDAANSQVAESLATQLAHRSSAEGRCDLGPRPAFAWGEFEAPETHLSQHCEERRAQITDGPEASAGPGASAASAGPEASAGGVFSQGSRGLGTARQGQVAPCHGRCRRRDRDNAVRANDQNGESVICMDVHTAQQGELEAMVGGNLDVTWSDWGTKTAKVDAPAQLTMQ